jgi:hypothetical protein
MYTLFSPLLKQGVYKRTMGEILKAIKYQTLDHALRALSEIMNSPSAFFDDAGEEPQGLLAVVPADRLPEEMFYRLFDVKNGILVEVEKIHYSGYGPPAEEEDYMGYASEKVAYVLIGCRFPIEIANCPQGATDIHHLETMVMDHHHPINREYLTDKLGLPPNWDFENLFDLIVQGQYTAEEIDRLIHRGIQ